MVGLDNPLHIAMVLVVVLLVFGAKRLPEMGKSLGEGLRGFKESVSGDSPGTRAPAQPPALQALPAATIAPIAPQPVAPHPVAREAVAAQAVVTDDPTRDPVSPAG